MLPGVVPRFAEEVSPSFKVRVCVSPSFQTAREHEPLCRRAWYRDFQETCRQSINVRVRVTLFSSFLVATHIAVLARDTHTTRTPFLCRPRCTPVQHQVCLDVSRVVDPGSTKNSKCRVFFVFFDVCFSGRVGSWRGPNSHQRVHNCASWRERCLVSSSDDTHAVAKTQVGDPSLC